MVRNGLLNVYARIGRTVYVSISRYRDKASREWWCWYTHRHANWFQRILCQLYLLNAQPDTYIGCTSAKVDATERQRISVSRLAAPVRKKGDRAPYIPVSSTAIRLRGLHRARGAYIDKVSFAGLRGLWVQLKVPLGHPPRQMRLVYADGGEEGLLLLLLLLPGSFLSPVPFFQLGHNRGA